MLARDTSGIGEVLTKFDDFNHSHQRFGSFKLRRHSNFGANDPEPRLTHGPHGVTPRSIPEGDSSPKLAGGGCGRPSVGASLAGRHSSAANDAGNGSSRRSEPSRVPSDRVDAGTEPARTMVPADVSTRCAGSQSEVTGDAQVSGHLGSSDLTSEQTTQRTEDLLDRQTIQMT